MKLEEAVSTCLKFYGTEVPKTVSEYIANYPKGLSRQVLKGKFDLTTGQFLKLLGSSYQEPIATKDKFIKACAERGLSIISIADYITKNTLVDVQCNTCKDLFSTYWGTLSLTKIGCQNCAGCKKLSERPEFLQEKADKVNSTVLSVPENNADKIWLKCKGCATEYSITTTHLTNPSTDKTATCPNCRDSDHRVTHEGITFGSQFERECYKLLKHLQPKIQQRYSTCFPTSRQWTCDFVIGDYWVEVTSYTKNSSGFATYSKNIEDKRALVESVGKSFIYLTSLREVRDFIDKI
jgi:hypothetical protein